MQTRAEQKLQKRKKSRNRKKKLITKTTRAKEQRERITRCESPNHRPIKKGTNEKSKQLVIGYLSPQRSTDYVLSKYTTSNTTELNSRC